MKYKSIDALGEFQFSDSPILDSECNSNSLKFQLANVTILASNTNNRDIMDMRTNDLILTFEDATITSFIAEGYKVYDANNNLTESVADEPFSKENYAQIIHNLSEATIYSIEEISNNQCVINMDIIPEMRTYSLTLSYSHSIAQWDRFLKK